MPAEHTIKQIRAWIMIDKSSSFNSYSMKLMLFCCGVFFFFSLSQNTESFFHRKCYDVYMSHYGSPFIKLVVFQSYLIFEINNKITIKYFQDFKSYVCLY